MTIPSSGLRETAVPTTIQVNGMGFRLAIAEDDDVEIAVDAAMPPPIRRQPLPCILFGPSPSHTDGARTPGSTADIATAPSPGMLSIRTVTDMATIASSSRMGGGGARSISVISALAPSSLGAPTPSNGRVSATLDSRGSSAVEEGEVQIDYTGSPGPSTPPAQIKNRALAPITEEDSDTPATPGEIRPAGEVTPPRVPAPLQNRLNLIDLPATSIPNPTNRGLEALIRDTSPPTEVRHLAFSRAANRAAARATAALHIQPPSDPAEAFIGLNPLVSSPTAASPPVSIVAWGSPHARAGAGRTVRFEEPPARTPPAPLVVEVAAVQAAATRTIQAEIASVTSLLQSESISELEIHALREALESARASSHPSESPLLTKVYNSSHRTQLVKQIKQWVSATRGKEGFEQYHETAKLILKVEEPEDHFKSYVVIYNIEGQIQGMAAFSLVDVNAANTDGSDSPTICTKVISPRIGKSFIPPLALSVTSLVVAPHNQADTAMEKDVRNSLRASGIKVKEPEEPKYKNVGSSLLAEAVLESMRRGFNGKIVLPMPFGLMHEQVARHPVRMLPSIFSGFGSEAPLTPKEAALHLEMVEKSGPSFTRVSGFYQKALDAPVVRSPGAMFNLTGIDDEEAAYIWSNLVGDSYRLAQLLLKHGGRVRLAPEDFIPSSARRTCSVM